MPVPCRRLSPTRSSRERSGQNYREPYSSNIWSNFRGYRLQPNRYRICSHSEARNQHGQHDQMRRLTSLPTPLQILVPRLPDLTKLCSSRFDFFPFACSGHVSGITAMIWGPGSSVGRIRNQNKNGRYPTSRMVSSSTRSALISTPRQTFLGLGHRGGPSYLSWHCSKGHFAGFLGKILMTLAASGLARGLSPSAVGSGAARALRPYSRSRRTTMLMAR